MKRVAQITLTIGATLLGIMLLYVFQPTLAMFGGSLALSAALRPLVQRLEARGVKRGIAILIWYLLIFAGFVVGVLLYGVGITTEVSLATEQLPQVYATFIENWQHGSTIQQAIAHGLPSFDKLIQSGSGSGGLAVIGGTVLGIASGSVSLLVFAFAALSLAYYWLIEVAHFERLWLSLLPVGARIRARDIWRNAEAAVGAYIRTTVLAISISALLLLALYRLSAIPFATLFALFGGISHLLPRLGPAIGVIVAVLVALAMRGPLPAIAIALIGTTIQIVIHKLAVRAMQQEAIKVNPLLQVLLLLAMSYIGGFWAMIFAPPLAALIQVLHTSLLSATTATQPQESALKRISERLDRLRYAPQADRMEIASAFRRSDELLEQARNMLDT